MPSRLKPALAKVSLISATLSLPKGTPYSPDALKGEKTNWDASFGIFATGKVAFIASRPDQIDSSKFESHFSRGQLIRDRAYITIENGPPIYDFDGKIIEPATHLQGTLTSPIGWGSVRSLDGKRLMGSFRLTQVKREN